MKELSKHLIRTGLPIRRNSGPRQPTQPTNETKLSDRLAEVEVPEKLAPYSPFAPLDSWKPATRETLTDHDGSKRAAKLRKEIDAGVYDAANPVRVEPVAPNPEDIMSTEDYLKVPKRGRPVIQNERKKRGVCISMSVSPEEAEALRRYAASLGLGFSEWARSVLFDKMGKNKPPKRPNAL